jgi:hypothetical protein
LLFRHGLSGLKYGRFKAFILYILPN